MGSGLPSTHISACMDRAFRTIQVPAVKRVEIGSSVGVLEHGAAVWSGKPNAPHLLDAHPPPVRDQQPAPIPRGSSSSSPILTPRRLLNAFQPDLAPERNDCRGQKRRHSAYFASQTTPSSTMASVLKSDHLAGPLIDDLLDASGDDEFLFGERDVFLIEIEAPVSIAGIERFQDFGE